MFRPKKGLKNVENGKSFPPVANWPRFNRSVMLKWIKLQKSGPSMAPKSSRRPSPKFSKKTLELLQKGDPIVKDSSSSCRQDVERLNLSYWLSVDLVNPL